MDAAKAFGPTAAQRDPRPAPKVTDDLDVLLAFYDFPTEHWIDPGAVTCRVLKLARQPSRPLQ